MSNVSLKVCTYFRLGLLNLWRVAWYRISVKLGLNPVRRLRAITPNGPFFRPSSGNAECIDVDTECKFDSINLFGHQHYSLLSEQPPNWFQSPFNGKQAETGAKEWWQISDFGLDVGDIKQIWELSRFDWVIKLAQNAACGDTASHQRLEHWLQDWIETNLPYQGVNWKCGQEASFRVLHLIVAAYFLNNLRNAERGLIQLVKLHLQRIAPTVSYAVAQDNNHGTSEAAAMYVGGLFLKVNGVRQGERWSRMGKRWLENRARRLIAEDGTFSQYSVNYHRLMLETLCLSELARQWFGSTAFSQEFNQRAQAATRWLLIFVEPETGDTPNLGANDGAQLLPLVAADYRDYRPAVILASTLFLRSLPRALAQRQRNFDVLKWFKLEVPDSQFASEDNAIFDDGGFAVLKNEQANVRAIVRYPRFKFRPGQNDLLHIDLWLGKENLLRDAGSYSYNCDEPWLSYFPSVAAHNTVQFDDREQMPRVSRFLLGAWPNTRQSKLFESENTRFTCSFVDNWSVSHQREVTLDATALKVTDTFNGFEKKAVARYRLSPLRNWTLDGCEISDGEHRIRVAADVPIASIRLVQGWESRYYFAKTEIPVLEIELHQNGSLTMEYDWVV